MSWLRRNALRHRDHVRIVLTGSIGIEPILRQAGSSPEELAVLSDRKWRSGGRHLHEPDSHSRVVWRQSLRLTRRVAAAGRQVVGQPSHRPKDAVRAGLYARVSRHDQQTLSCNGHRSRGDGERRAASGRTDQCWLSQNLPEKELPNAGFFIALGLSSRIAKTSGRNCYNG